jgi:iron complex outermembrane receptor protein
MTTATSFFRKRVLLAGASALVFSSLTTVGANADQATSTQVAATIGQSSSTSESVIVRAQKRLLKEKNSPSAVTELGTAQISANGIGGSPSSLLRQAPSVFVYQQGLGDNAPELTVRGVRGLEIASTLDGVPTQDLEAPGAFYLANNIGGVFTTNEISSVSIYPGVAYPDKSTFGTIGGTIAYDSKRPTNDFYFDVTGTIGSFGTAAGGFELNSGAIDSPLGTGDNAAKFLLNYRNFQTEGFIDGTSSRENEMEAAFDKPYNDGLSKFQATVLYNQADGFIQNEPVPVPYLAKNGMYSNYPTNLEFAKENNDFLTVILKDDTYVNDYLNVGLTTFYLANNNNLETYANPTLFPNVFASPIYEGPLTVNGAAPFINNPAGFGEEGLYGPPVGGVLNGAPYGIYGGGYGGYFYGKGNHYNPDKYYNSKDCPASVVAVWGSYGSSPCGLNDQITGGHADTYGVQPRATIIVPEIAGIDNTIKIGGLFAKETQPAGYAYLGGTPNTPMDASNLQSERIGGTERTIYQGYIQDKIDLLDNTLHITPGGTAEGTFSSFKSADAFVAQCSEKAAVTTGACNPVTGAFGANGYLTTGGPGNNIDKYGSYKAVKWDREYLPFLNVSYDFDKIAPVLTGVTVYGSVANSALFAPVGDFGPNSAGVPPNASIVHLYEGGVKYNTSNLVLSADYFYQKVDRDFGFFSFQSGPQNGESDYNDNGQREMKGFEAAATYQVTPSIQLFGNVSHLLAKYLQSGFALDTVAEDQYGIESKGSPQSGIPDWLSTFGVDYSKKTLFLDNDSLNIRITGQYTGHQYTTFDYNGSAFTSVPNFTGLAPLSYTPVPGYESTCGYIPPSTPGGQGSNPGCAAYTRYNQVTGATTTNRTGGGISPFALFNLDATYTLPTPQLPLLKHIVFDANVQNIFNQKYFQYFYSQISPAECGTFTSGPFKGLQRNNYSCTPSFQDGIPGQPFGVYFTVTARF